MSAADQRCSPRHFHQPRNLICINPDCLRKAFCCAFCIADAHHDHPLLPASVFLESLQSILFHAISVSNNRPSTPRLDDGSEQKQHSEIVEIVGTDPNNTIKEDTQQDQRRAERLKNIVQEMKEQDQEARRSAGGLLSGSQSRSSGSRGSGSRGSGSRGSGSDSLNQQQNGSGCAMRSHRSSESERSREKKQETQKIPIARKTALLSNHFDPNEEIQISSEGEKEKKLAQKVKKPWERSDEELMNCYGKYFKEKKKIMSHREQDGHTEFFFVRNENDYGWIQEGEVAQKYVKRYWALANRLKEHDRLSEPHNGITID